MRVFVTGATGFVGSAVVSELIGAGHQVVGLARSEAGAAAVAAAGATPHRGELADLDSLRSGARAADAVIHLAFHHDFSQYVDAAALDRQAIVTLGEALDGPDRALVVASGLAGLSADGLITEDDVPASDSPRVSESAAWTLLDRGVRVSAVRLPPTVHDKGDHGFVPRLIEVARDKGVAGYPGDGTNHWPAVHRRDAARAFRLAVEQAPAGSVLQAIGEQGIATRDIAAVIGKQLSLPVKSIPADQVAEHFGWIGAFFALDLAASGALTTQRFGWQPTHIGLIEELDAGYYFG